MNALATMPLLANTIEVGPGLHCDIDRLIATRLLVQANSGGGKTRTLRRLLEQSHGKVQHLVIDPEGEYFTMRERFDYVLASPKGGDAVAHPRTAALLAERLLQLGVSAILDIYELNPDDRIEFVRLFFEALVNAPRELWHPVMVVLDEAHVFAPENGQAASATAVAALASRGRKRGFCLVPATQRIALFAKAVSAECNNKLVGRCVQDVDMARAGKELGFASKSDVMALRMLDPGQFYAFGPAFDVREPRLVKVGPVLTSHPEAGQQAAPVPPPTAHVRAILEQLADLPAEAEEREHSIETLQAENARLGRQLTEGSKTGDRRPEPAVERVEVPVISDDRMRVLEMHADVVERAREQLARVSEDLAIGVANLDATYRAVMTDVAAVRRPQLLPVQRVERQEVASVSRPQVVRGTTSGGELSKSERAILTVLAQHPEGCERGKLTLLSGYAWTGTFRTYLSALRTAGYIVGGNQDRMTATDAGLAALGDYDPLPTGKALGQYWSTHSRFNETERAILRALLAHPLGLTAEQVCAAVDKEWTGTMRTYLSNLRTAGVLVGKNGEVMRAHGDLLA